MEILQRKPLEGRVRKHQKQPVRHSGRTAAAAAVQRAISSQAASTTRLTVRKHDGVPPQDLPTSQLQLQLHGPKQDFQLTSDASLPARKREDELLIEVKSIGLNPVDWKGPAFNFGLPSFPCVLGRDLVGTIVDKAGSQRKFDIGDRVLAVSTDYRDYRKSAFQQFAVATDFNVCRIPSHISTAAASAVGVAFVTAALTLGISLGLRPPPGAADNGSPDLWALVRSLEQSSVPEDVRHESLHALEDGERLQRGDWLAIWGASSTVGFITLQLAKRAGVKVICIADAIKHGQCLVTAGADVLVHRSNTDEAVKIVQAVTGDRLFFGVDAVGKETAGLLQSTLTVGSGSPRRRSHIVGLTGLPKEHPQEIVQHALPVKLFHESPAIGSAVMSWLDKLLHEDALVLPKIDLADPGGLEGVNGALGRLRGGTIDAHRIVVQL